MIRSVGELRHADDRAVVGSRRGAQSGPHDSGRPARDNAAPSRMAATPMTGRRSPLGTVLVTGAGGPAAVTVLRSLAGHAELVAADIDPVAVGLYLVPADRRVLLPRGDDPGVRRRPAGARAMRHGADLVVPTVDTELRAVSAAARPVRRARHRPAGRVGRDARHSAWTRPTLVRALRRRRSGCPARCCRRRRHGRGRRRGAGRAVHRQAAAGRRRARLRRSSPRCADARRPCRATARIGPGAAARRRVLHRRAGPSRRRRRGRRAPPPRQGRLGHRRGRPHAWPTPTSSSSAAQVAELIGAQRCRQRAGQARPRRQARPARGQRALPRHDVADAGRRRRHAAARGAGRAAAVRCPTTSASVRSRSCGTGTDIVVPVERVRRTSTPRWCRRADDLRARGVTAATARRPCAAGTSTGAATCTPTPTSPTARTRPSAMADAAAGRRAAHVGTVGPRAGRQRLGRRVRDRGARAATATACRCPCGVEAKMLDRTGRLDLPAAPARARPRARRRPPVPRRRRAGVLRQRSGRWLADGRLAAADVVDTLVAATCAGARAVAGPGDRRAPVQPAAQDRPRRGRRHRRAPHRAGRRLPGRPTARGRGQREVASARPARPCVGCTAPASASCAAATPTGRPRSAVAPTGTTSWPSSSRPSSPRPTPAP